MRSDFLAPGYSLAWIYDEVTSTMDVARDSIPLLGEHSGVVCARSQSAGRGRQGRSWSSSQGAMMATFLFQTTAPVASLSGYSLAVGLGLVDAFAQFEAKLLLKWPNDLVIVRDGGLRKVGGILIEVQDLGDKRVILVGVGINLRQTPREVPHATSIEEISGRILSIEQGLLASCERLKTAHEIFTSFGGFSRLRERWAEVTCFSKGVTEIAIEVGDRLVRGVYAGVDESGSLLLSLNEGVQSFHSGHLVECRGLRA